MRSVLAIGAHPDDIELGCGGALLHHVRRGDSVCMLVVTNGEAGPGETHRRCDEQTAAARLLGIEDLHFGQLPDGRVSHHELALVHLIEGLLARGHVDTVYTHHAEDSHQDHRSVALATWGAARWIPNVLGYESPSSLHFSPSVFIDIADVIEGKVAALACHRSQIVSSNMASVPLVLSQGSFRGHQGRVPMAEGFVSHRLVLW